MDRLTLRRIAMVAALAAASAASCVAPRPAPAPAPLPSRERAEPVDVASRLIEAHNAIRSRRGLPPLSASPALEAAASAQARDMADRRKMAHKGGDGSSPFDRMERQGYRFRAAAENVAHGFDDVDQVMAGWMRSPGHRRNILGKYAEMGAGRATGADGASYWCVTFGTPEGG